MGAERPYVAVVGGGEADPDVLAIAEDVGRHLARRDAVVLCGGLGGVMEAACRGAKAEGGTAVGILPTDDRHHANAYVDVAIATGMGEARNALVVRAADVVLADDGESPSPCARGRPSSASPRGSCRCKDGPWTSSCASKQPRTPSKLRWRWPRPNLRPARRKGKRCPTSR